MRHYKLENVDSDSATSIFTMPPKMTIAKDSTITHAHYKRLRFSTLTLTIEILKYIKKRMR